MLQLVNLIKHIKLTYAKNKQMNNIDYDKAHIWHPYTSATEPLPCYGVSKTDGVHITLASGEVMIDGMSSWWAAIHGYNHPHINAAVKRQVDEFSHIMFGGLTHEPAIKLAKQLLAMVPDGLNRVFFADSGSVSVEVTDQNGSAIFCLPRSATLNTKFSHRAMDTTGILLRPCRCVIPLTGCIRYLKMSSLANFCTSATDTIWSNMERGTISPLIDTLNEHHHEIAAIMLEPVVQGAGGMRLYHPEYVRRVRQLCDEYNILLIADEIATGFGRTGKLFACEHADITPDILCLGKALTGGYMTMAATLCTEDVALGYVKGHRACSYTGPHIWVILWLAQWLQRHWS